MEGDAIISIRDRIIQSINANDDEWLRYSGFSVW